MQVSEQNFLTFVPPRPISAFNDDKLYCTNEHDKLIYFTVEQGDHIYHTSTYNIILLNLIYNLIHRLISIEMPVYMSSLN